MIDLSSIHEEFSEDINAVQSWSDEVYQSHFSSYFKDQRDLYMRLKSKQHPITDSELEDILTTMPLELFTVSEILSQFKVSMEVIKIKVKQLEAEKVAESEQKAMTNKKEEAALKTLEHKLLSTVYSTVISRVTNEIDFSRELIMGAKKIWDSRRNTDSSNPVGHVVNDDSTLPDYRPGDDSSGGKMYIR